MACRDGLAVFLALNCARHATEVYHNFGLLAGVLAVVFMLAAGEVLRAWIKMIKLR